MDALEIRARAILDLHADPIPVAVESGRWFMVREQDALDAIIAALTPQWLPIESAPRDVPLLVTCATPSGRMVRLIAVYCSKHTQEAGDDYADSEWCDYDEASDTYYCPEGWYEQIKNWDELTAVHISDMTPVAYMPLPSPPEGVE